MLILLALPLILCIFFVPVSIRADAYHQRRTRADISLRWLLFRKTWHIRGFSGAAQHLTQQRNRTLLSVLRRADKARTFLLRHTRIDSLDALFLLRTEDAARSALLSAAMRGILQCIPAVRRRNIRIRVLPDFFRDHSAISARCIIRIRLGIILLTALLLLAAYIRDRRQQKARHAYGTSHW